MLRVKRTGVEHPRPYMSPERSKQVRAEIDAFLDTKIDEWKATVPFSTHLEGAEIHKAWYVRQLIETVWRIRLIRVAESKALPEIAKITPEGAQIYAKYQFEEMLHDDLFLMDLESQGHSREDVTKTEPYLSTKLLMGYFSYLLDHEGPLGVVAYSYLVEYANVKLEPKKIEAMKKSLGDKAIKGAISHSNTDTYDDHPGEVWDVIHRLILSESDIQALYEYLAENQRILAMFFHELYEETVTGKKKSAARPQPSTN